MTEIQSETGPCGDIECDGYCNICCPPRKPLWICQECGHKDEKKPMPKDRVAFYKNESPKCPKCKSASFVPQGF